MASFHWSMQIIGRKDGRSAIRAAAYRAGQDLRDHRTGEIFRYAQRWGVAWTEVMLPEGANPELSDREALWNAVEKAEVRDDAQLAREVNIALPHELSFEQRQDLLRRYVLEEFVAKGMIADVAMHVPRPGRGEDERNVHAHVMLTLRQGTPLGLRTVKTREWNSRDALKRWRLAWAEHANRALHEAGIASRIDAHSLAVQRQIASDEGDDAKARSFERVPEVHMGPNAVEMARKVARHRADVLESSSQNKPALPDRVAENGFRIGNNTVRAWQRHADAEAEAVRWERQRLLEPRLSVTREDGSVLAYSNLVDRHDRPAPRGEVGRIIRRMRDTEVTEHAIKVLRGSGHDLGEAPNALAELLSDVQRNPVQSSPFQVTAKDLAFAFFRMGLLSLERLSATLELIEAEHEIKRASARGESFWSRILPARRSRNERHARPLVRKRRRASDPNDP